MTIKKLIGSDPNQVPMNKDLGSMAYASAENGFTVGGDVYTVTGGSIMGEWTYVQYNAGQDVGHDILWKDLKTQFSAGSANNNLMAEIVVVCLGTGTTGMYCKYAYNNNSDNNGAQLTHLHGNNTQNSNRPYMVLNGQTPQWKMSHPGSYMVRVHVKVYGGSNTYIVY